MTPLVEVHNEEELAMATEVGASLVGINARDLTSLQVDPTAFGRLAPKVKKGVVKVAESGVQCPHDLARYAHEGADAVLVGQYLSSAPDPAQAVRELVANALMHREYHQLAHGSQVRIELYPDRLEVVSPGGLFGALRADALGAETVTSSRNSVLGRLLEDISMPGENRMVCENRGTGLLAVSAALRQSGLEPTAIRNSLSEFRVILRRQLVLDADMEAWLDTLPLAGVSQRQKLCLAYLRREGSITNSAYRALTGSAAPAAAKDLEGLATRGLAIRDNLGKSVKWRLNPTAATSEVTSSTVLTGRKLDIVTMLAAGPMSASVLAERLGVSPGAVRHHLQELEAAGTIAPTAVKKSPRNTWVLVEG
jgi:ATP-dependent DNA helicase RecG